MSPPLTSGGTTPLHSVGCCCAVVFSLIIEHGNGQGPIKNISDAIITLAARKMNQIVSIGLTNGLGFNFASTIGLVASFISRFLKNQVNFAEETRGRCVKLNFDLCSLIVVLLLL